MDYVTKVDRENDKAYRVEMEWEGVKVVFVLDEDNQVKSLPKIWLYKDLLRTTEDPDVPPMVSAQMFKQAYGILKGKGQRIMEKMIFSAR